MTKKEIVKVIAKETGYSNNTVKKIIESLFNNIPLLVVNEDIYIRGFGTFKVKESNSRIGRNPNTGERVNIPIRKYVVFKPGKAFKDILRSNDI